MSRVTRKILNKGTKPLIRLDNKSTSEMDRAGLDSLGSPEGKYSVVQPTVTKCTCRRGGWELCLVHSREMK